VGRKTLSRVVERSTNIEKEVYGRLLKFVSRRISHPEDAEEIVQNVYLKLIQQESREKIEQVQAWLFTTTRNAVVDYYRKKSSTTLKQLCDEEFQIEENSEERKQIASCLLPLLERLHASEAEALRAVDIEGVTQKDFAESKGLPYSTFKSQMQRARTRLKESLFDCCKMTLNTKGIPVEIASGNECC
jgi:RNA polymerase sigma-70 factor (ECF subfamily)